MSQYVKALHNDGKVRMCPKLIAENTNAGIFDRQKNNKSSQSVWQLLKISVKLVCCSSEKLKGGYTVFLKYGDISEK